MNIPWVSREVYNNAVAARNEALAGEAKWQLRYDLLFDRYAKLVEREKPEPVKLPERSRDQVIEAIVAKAGNNGHLRQHLGAWAAEQRLLHVPEEEIVQHILVWESPGDALD